MSEIWKDIKGYEGRYQVSNLGRVKSLNTKSKTRFYKGDVLISFKDSMGYMCINLSRKLFKIHRLVADAFLDNPSGYRCVNHKDEDKTNNKVDNLEWCDYKYNNNYGTRNKRISQNLGKKVIQYSLNGEKIREWSSVTEAARFYNRKPTTIAGCCHRRQHTSCGYIWRYCDE